MNIKEKVGGYKKYYDSLTKFIPGWFVIVINALMITVTSDLITKGSFIKFDLLNTAHIILAKRTHLRIELFSKMFKYFCVLIRDSGRFL